MCILMLLITCSVVGADVKAFRQAEDMPVEKRDVAVKLERAVFIQSTCGACFEV